MPSATVLASRQAYRIIFTAGTGDIDDDDRPGIYVSWAFTALRLCFEQYQYLPLLPAILTHSLTRGKGAESSRKRQTKLSRDIP